ncbi:MAG: hypothetical protein K9L79_05030 [Methylobacter tundripaludum]|nr:hypothetical protein [Methylobacter tundripaludum]
MAKRMTKAEANLISLVVIIGIPVWLASTFVEKVGWNNIINLVVVVFILVFIYNLLAFIGKFLSARARKSALLKKYKDAILVDKILGGYFWVGQSSEQLIDSLGKPADVDRKVLKTKIKEVWKYNPRGLNRYGLRITLDDGFVVGWDNKT